MEPTDAECQDVEDIGGRHIHNRWPCKFFKYTVFNLFCFLKEIISDKSTHIL